MDEYFFLFNQADKVIKQPPSFYNNENLFVSSVKCSITGSEEDLDQALGENSEKILDDMHMFDPFE